MGPIRVRLVVLIFVILVVVGFVLATATSDPSTIR